MSKTLIIGSRGSDLALWQAHYVQSLLAGIGAKAEIKIIKTQGDRIQDIGFDKMEGKGFFTKELEDQLLAGNIDLAVHSHKDLETTSPAGLTVAAVSERADPRDVMIARSEATDEKGRLKQGAVIGTSSARRKSQTRSLLPDAVIEDLRGNVPTRVEKLRTGAYDAILLAKAGLDRLNLNLSDLVVNPLNPEVFVPAPAQGALAVQTRSDDSEVIAIVSQLNHPATEIAVRAERLVLNRLEGGCQLPLGVFCQSTATGYRLIASHASEAFESVRKYELEGVEPVLLAERMIGLISQHG